MTIQHFYSRDEWRAAQVTGEYRGDTPQSPDRSTRNTPPGCGKSRNEVLDLVRLTRRIG
ncbi:MAG: hypothetical protein ACR2F6_01875 [Mycobacteriales bacterium]